MYHERSHSDVILTSPVVRHPRLDGINLDGCWGAVSKPQTLPWIIPKIVQLPECQENQELVTTKLIRSNSHIQSHTEITRKIFASDENAGTIHSGLVQSYQSSKCQSPSIDRILLSGQSSQTDCLDYKARHQARHHKQQSNIGRLEYIYSGTTSSPSASLEGSILSVITPSQSFDLIPRNLTISSASLENFCFNQHQQGLSSLLNTCGSTHYSEVMLCEKKKTTEDRMNVRKAEQERVQKKTFTNWMNACLSKVEPPIIIDDIFVDIRDGLALIRVLELLSGETLAAENRRKMQKIHWLANVKTALEFLESKQIKLVNINPADIVDGKPAIVLGLIWTIILHFQIEEQEKILQQILGLPEGTRPFRGRAKEMLKKWVQDIVMGKDDKYNISVRDFGPSWRDGYAFNAMVHNIDATLVQMDELKSRSRRENLEHAFTQAAVHLGIPKLLDPEDVDVERPDEKSIMTYVAQFFKAYPEVKHKVDDQGDMRSAEGLIAQMRMLQSDISEYMRTETNTVDDHITLYNNTLDVVSRCQTNLDTLTNQSDGNKSSALELATEVWDNLQKDIDRWRWHIDSLISEPLGTVARWLSLTEQWLRRVRRTWIVQRPVTKRLGMSGHRSESWRPSSADPPNSPPSLKTVQKLLDEQEDLFGPNNHKLSKMRDTLNKVNDVSTSSISRNTNFLIQDHLIGRLKSITSAEPGHTTALRASHARRSFLDILFATAIEESDNGVTIRSRRKTSKDGLERRLANWSLLLDGSVTEENKTLVEDYLVDYERCIELEKIPEKLDEVINQLRGHHDLLVRLEDLANEMIPQNAVKSVQDWIRDGIYRWNEEKLRRLEHIGSGLKRRLDAWDSLDRCTGCIERHITNAQRRSSTGIETPISKHVELERWLEEADDAIQFLGNTAEHEQLQQLKHRLDKVNETIQLQKSQEDERNRSKLQRQKTEIENNLIDRLDATDRWIVDAYKTVDFVRPTNSNGTEFLKNTCWSEKLSAYRDKLNNVRSELPNIEEDMHQLYRLAADPKHSWLHEIYAQRIQNTHTKLVELGLMFQSRKTFLDDFGSKMEWIENQLSKIEGDIKRTNEHVPRATSELQCENLLTECINLQRELRSCHESLDDMDKFISTERNIAVINNLDVNPESCREKADTLLTDLTRVESTLKQKLKDLHTWQSEIEDAQRKLQNLERNLKHLTNAVQQADPDELPKLLKQIEKLKIEMDDGKTALQMQQSMIHSDQSELSSLEHKYTQQLNELVTLRDLVQTTIKQMECEKDELSQFQTWIGAQERRLNSLKLGPTPFPIERMGSGEQLRCTDQKLDLNSYSQWSEECVNFLNTMEMEANQYEKSIESIHSPNVQSMTKYKETLLQLSNKHAQLKEAANKLTRDSQVYLTMLRKVSEQLDQTSQWVESIHKFKGEFHIDHTDTASLQTQESKLRDLLQNLSIEEEARFSECKNIIDLLSDCGEHDQIRNSTMSARRKLSNLQTDMRKTKRQLEADLESCQLQTTRRNEILSRIQCQENWLSDIQTKIHHPPPRLENDEHSSMDQLFLATKTTISQLRQTSQLMKSRVQITRDQLSSDIKKLKIDYLNDRLNQWYMKANSSQEDVNDALKDWELFEENLAKIQPQFYDLESQLIDLEQKHLSMLDKSVLGPMDDKNSILEILKETMKSLKTSLLLRPNIDQQLEAIRSVCQIQLHCEPIGLKLFEQRVIDIFDNLKGEHSQLSDHVERTKHLLSNLNEQQKIVSDLEQIHSKPKVLKLEEFEENPITVIRTDLQYHIDLLQDILCLLESQASPSNSSLPVEWHRLTILQQESRQELDLLTSQSNFMRQTLSNIWPKWKTRLERVLKATHLELNRSQKLASLWKTAENYRVEFCAIIDQIETEYQEIKKNQKAENLNNCIQDIRELLNRLKIDGADAQSNLQDAFDGVLNNATSIDRAIYADYLPRIMCNLDDRYEALRSKITTLMIDQTKVAKNEKSFSDEIDSLTNNLHNLFNETEALSFNLSSSFNLSDFRDSETSLIQVCANQRTVRDCVDKLNHRIQSASTVSRDLSDRMRKLDQFMHKTDTSIEQCQMLQRNRQTLLTQHNFLLEKLSKSIGQRRIRIDNLSDISGGDLSSFEAVHIKLTRQLNELILIGNEITQCQQILNVQSNSGAASGSDSQAFPSSLVDSSRELVKRLPSLEHATEQPEWLKLTDALKGCYDQLCITQSKLNTCCNSIREWTNQMGRLETSIQEIDMRMNEDEGAYDEMSNKLKEFKTELNYLSKTANQILGQMTLEGSGLISSPERLQNAQVRLEDISNRIENKIAQYSKESGEEEILYDSINEVLQWVRNYGRELEVLKQRLETVRLPQAPSFSPSEWIEESWTILKQLERERDNGTERFRELIKRSRTAKIPADRVKELEDAKSTLLDPGRLERLRDRLKKVQHCLETYELKLIKVKQKINDYKSLLKQLEPADFQTTTLTDIVSLPIDRYKRGEQKLKKLMDEVETSKSSNSTDLEKLESELPTLSSHHELASLNIEFNRLLGNISQSLQATIDYNESSNTISKSIRLFERAVDETMATYSAIIEIFKHDIDAVDDVPEQHVIKCTDLIKIALETSIESMKEISSKEMIQAENLWKAVLENLQNTQMSDQLEQSLPYRRLCRIKDQVSKADTNLKSMLEDISNFQRVWTEIESKIDTVDEKMSTMTNAVLDMSTWSRPSACYPVFTEVQMLPDAANILQESTQNMFKLKEQIQTEQVQLDELRKIQLDQRKNTISLESGNRMIGSIFKCLTSFLLQHSNNSSTNIPKSTNTHLSSLQIVQTRHLSALKELSIKIDTNQTNLSNLARLVQTVKKLDTWCVDFYGTLREWRQHNRHLNLSEIRFQLETGTMLMQSVTDWSEQIRKLDNGSGCIYVCAEFQAQRAKQLVRCATDHLDRQTSEIEKEAEHGRVVQFHVTNLNETISSWSMKLTQLQRNVSSSLMQCANPAESKLLDSKMRWWLEQALELQNEVRTNKNIAKFQLTSVSELTDKQRTQLVEIENSLEGNEKTINDYVDGLRQLRLDWKDVDKFLHKTSTRLHDLSEKISTLSNNQDLLHVQPNDSQSDSSTRLLQTWNGMRSELDKFSSDFHQTWTTLSGKLEANVLSLGAEPIHWSADAEQLVGGDELERLKSTCIQHCSSMEKSKGLQDQVRDRMNKWAIWYGTVIKQYIQLVGQSTVGLRGISEVVLNGGNSEDDLVSLTIVDVVRPVINITQQIQTTKNELLPWHSKLNELESSISKFAQQSFKDDLSQNHNRVLSEYNNTRKYLTDSMTALQHVAAEEREFDEQIEHVYQWIKIQQMDEIPVVGQNKTTLPILEEKRERYKRKLEEIENYHKKFSELNDKADRICRTASNAALALGRILTLNTTTQRQQLGSVSPTRTLSPQSVDFVGRRTKRELGALWKQWQALTQHVNQLLENTNQLLETHADRVEIENHLLSWLNNVEEKFDRLERGDLTQTIEGGMSCSDQMNWNFCLQEYKQLRREISQMSADFQKLPPTPPSSETRAMPSTTRDLVQRHTKLQEQVRLRTEWLSNMDLLVQQFNQCVQDADRWLSKSTIKLMEFYAISNENTPEQLTNGRMESTLSSTKQPERYLSDLKTETTRVCHRLHEVVHLLVHTALQSDPRTQSICGSIHCDFREIPFKPSLLNQLQFRLQSNHKHVNNLTLRAVERTIELEGSFVAFGDRVQSKLEQLNEEKLREKERLEQLCSAATFLTSVLPDWWDYVGKYGVGDASKCPRLDFPPTHLDLRAVSVPYLSGQLEHLGLTQSDQLPRLVLRNFEACSQLQVDASRLENCLNTILNEVSFSFLRITSVHQTQIVARGVMQSAVEQLAHRVKLTTQREAHKLQILLEKLALLRPKWERYVSERDKLLSWLKDREAAVQHLLELPYRSNVPADDEARAIEDFLATLRTHETALNDLIQLHMELVPPDYEDPILSQLKNDYTNLCERSEARLRKLQQYNRQQQQQQQLQRNQQVTKDTVPDGSNPTLPMDKVDSLARHSKQNLKHTRVLNQLAKSVRKVNKEMQSKTPNNYNNQYGPIRNVRAIQTLRAAAATKTMQPESIRENLYTMDEARLRQSVPSLCDWPEGTYYPHYPHNVYGPQIYSPAFHSTLHDIPPCTTSSDHLYRTRQMIKKNGASTIPGTPNRQLEATPSSMWQRTVRNSTSNQLSNLGIGKRQASQIPVYKSTHAKES